MQRAGSAIAEKRQGNKEYCITKNQKQKTEKQIRTGRSRAGRAYAEGKLR